MLLLAVLVSAFYLVHTQYESRRLYTAIDKANAQAHRLAQPGRQLAELHRRGYYRAWRSKVTGEVILERSHYDAVARGRGMETPEPAANRPQVRPPNIRRVK